MKPDEIKKLAEKTVENTVDLAVGQAANLIADFEAALLDVDKQAREEIVSEVIQILNDESDLRMDELVSLKNKVYSLESKPSTASGKDGGI